MRDKCLLRSSKADCNRQGDEQTTIAGKVNLVFPWCERIPFSVETSERFLSVDGSGKRVVKMAFDENIKKRSCSN